MSGRVGWFNLKNLPWEGYGYFLEQRNMNLACHRAIGPLHELVTWYGINYACEIHSGTFKTKELVPIKPDFPLF